MKLMRGDMGGAAAVVSAAWAIAKLQLPYCIFPSFSELPLTLALQCQSRCHYSSDREHARTQRYQAW
jgi:hypothetical protein